MVATKKFSEFAAGSLTNTTNKLVGVSALSGGSNFYTDYPLVWTTAARPVMPPAGTFGYNNNLGQIEYWNGAAWVQLAAGGSGSVNAGIINQLAFYASTGSAVSGFNNSPSSVLSTTSGSMPQWVTTLPSALTVPLPNITGVTNASNAASGSVGEVISSVVAVGSAVTLPNATATDITSISLTAGDWDVWGNVTIQWPTNQGVTGSSWISSTSGTQPDLSLQAILIDASRVLVTFGSPIPQLRFNLSTTTTIYLSAYATTDGGTINGCGGIYARRVR